MLSYYIIYYEMFRKGMQRTEKEALNVSISKRHLEFKHLLRHKCYSALNHIEIYMYAG